MLTFTNRKSGAVLRCVFRAAFPGHADPTVLSALAFCMREEYADTYSDPRIYDVNALTRMVEEGKLLTGAALREDTADARAADLSRGVILIGSEGRGLSGEALAACGGTVKIPMSSRCESLNAAVAAAILLWEGYRECCAIDK